MAAKRVYTKENIKEFESLRAEGFTYPQIGELTGFNPDSIRAKMAYIRNADRIKTERKAKELAKEDTLKLNAEINKVVNNHHEPDTYAPIPAPAKDKTLNDFTPREMFKHLYNLGYRVEGKIYYTKKEYVNLNSVINE